MTKKVWVTPKLRKISAVEIEQNPEMKKAVAELKRSAAKRSGQISNLNHPPKVVRRFGIAEALAAACVLVVAVVLLHETVLH